MDNEIELNDELIDVYCLLRVLGNHRARIYNLIKEKIPNMLQNKIIDVGFNDENNPDFMELEIYLNESDMDIVFPALNGVYPKYDWQKVLDGENSKIVLVLDDDVLAYLPSVCYEEY